MSAPPAEIKANECSAPECSTDRYRREWCQKHYERWKVHGDTSVILRAANGTYSAGQVACAVGDCDLKAVTCGYCGKHYQRLLKHGDPLVVLPTRVPSVTPKRCSIEGCDAQAIARTWCRRHYMRWHAHGDPEPVPASVAGADNPFWKGESAGYNAKHARVQRLRGKADSCAWGCTETFRFEWACMTGDYDNPDDYASLCVLCHRRYDRAVIRTATDPPK